MPAVRATRLASRGCRVLATWSEVQERDRMGDDLPPDYVTEIKVGGFYGWPYAYNGPTKIRVALGETRLVRKQLSATC